MSVRHVMRQQPWGEAGGAHTQEVDKVFIGPTRVLIVSRGLTTKRVSDSLGVPKFPAIKFASAPFPACTFYHFTLTSCVAGSLRRAGCSQRTPNSSFSCRTTRPASARGGVIEGKLRVVFVRLLLAKSVICRRGGHDRRNKITITREGRR